MSEIDAEVLRRLVTRRKNDGRAVYDLQAKAEVVRACLGPQGSGIPQKSARFPRASGDRPISCRTHFVALDQ